jgi:hypothetical protein
MKMLNCWLIRHASIDLKNTTFTIKDGDSPVNSIEIKIGEGDLTYTETVTREYMLNRGLLDDVRNGDQVPMDVRFDFKWEYLEGTTGSGAIPSIEDALKRINAAADWVSTDSDQCRPFAVDIIVMHTPTPSTCGDQEEVTLPDFRYETLEHSARNATVACAGKCNATQASIVRSAQTS